MASEDCFSLQRYGPFGHRPGVIMRSFMFLIVNMALVKYRAVFLHFDDKLLAEAAIYLRAE
jgi:hypothetical protein